jgi:hypothetical protein
MEVFEVCIFCICIIPIVIYLYLNFSLFIGHCVFQNNSWTGRNCLPPGCSLFDRADSNEKTSIIFYLYEGLQFADTESYKGHNSGE